ncbi:MAG: hypothetical protein WCZ46_10015 [Proteiniphilum sp.]
MEMMRASQAHFEKPEKKKKKKTFQKSFGIKKKSLSLHPLLEGIPRGNGRKPKEIFRRLTYTFKDKAEYTRVL